MSDQEFSQFIDLYHAICRFLMTLRRLGTPQPVTKPTPERLHWSEMEYGRTD